MTDDGFVFGDDADEDADEEALFGARSEDEPNTATETDRRFGTPATDDTDSRTQRIRTAVSGTNRTAVMVVLALAFVVVLGLVTYPLVMGALDMVDGPADSGASDGSAGVGGTLTTTVSTTDETGATETTTAPTTNGPTATPTTTAPPTTTATANTAATASPTTVVTPTPTTPVPTQGFPAGTPIETNETTDSA